MKYPIGSVGHAWITICPILVATPFFLYFAYYSLSHNLTGELIPWKQPVANAQRDEIYERIFGKDGLADRNYDNMLTFEEKVYVYRCMGYTEQFTVGERFPAPKTSALEKGIETCFGDR